MLLANERIRNRLKRIGILIVILLAASFVYTNFYHSLFSPRTTVQLSPLAFSDVKNLSLTDPKLLEYLRQEVLVPPSTLPYALTEESVKWPSLFTKQLKQIFGNKTDGFFIECGANDGEFLSNTLNLEKEGWKGFLIEAQPELGQKLRTKNRKAWFANVCLSPYLNISEIQFAVGQGTERWKDALGKLLLPDNKIGGHRLYGKVPCFPLVSLLAAIGVKHVDYISLDVEGVEMKILKTLPFDETLVIDYIQLEVSHLPEGAKAVKTFLKAKGYDFLFNHAEDAFYKRRVKL
ncbi:unnamed protein product [Allacma fusca]|uniref:Methyltransferase FkbM domain-containing protein n=1 Tax=Allacma fusca TaxID=39272 RepID=A0A8J2M4E9_9HEXA|nr:unnamed protein product [Allacma fusca]